jgi:hypothetical protein
MTLPACSPRSGALRIVRDRWGTYSLNVVDTLMLRFIALPNVLTVAPVPIASDRRQLL